MLTEKKLVNFPKISSKFKMEGSYYFKTASLNDTLELLDSGELKLINAKVNGSWTCSDGLLQMKIGEKKYSAELSYDGLKLKLFEPFSEVNES